MCKDTRQSFNSVHAHEDCDVQVQMEGRGGGGLTMKLLSPVSPADHTMGLLHFMKFLESLDT